MRRAGRDSEKVETCLIILVLNNSSRIPNVINFPSVFFKFLDMLSGIFGNLVRPNRHVICSMGICRPSVDMFLGNSITGGFDGIKGKRRTCRD